VSCAERIALRTVCVVPIDRTTEKENHLVRPSFFYATPSRRSPAVILAVDAAELPNVDDHVRRWTKKNFAVVVLVGDRFCVEPLLPGHTPERIGKVSAQPAWRWCADYLPQARDVIFIP
jgi:hypothetical protein